MTRIAGALLALSLAFLPATAPQAQEQLELTLDAYVAVMKAQGNRVAFADKSVADDDSVTYSEFSYTSADGQVSLDAPWIRFAPTGTEWTTRITLADMAELTVTPLNPDGSEGAPLAFDLANSGLEIDTNAIVPDPTILDRIDVALRAGQLSIAGDNPASPSLKMLLASFEALESNFSYDAVADRVAGELVTDTLALDYDFASEVEGMRSVSASRTDDVRLDYAFDIGRTEEEFKDYLTGYMSGELSLDAGNSSYTGTTEQDGSSFAFSGTATGSQLEAAIKNAVLTYAGTFGPANYAFTQTGGTMPLPPIDADIGGGFFDLRLPLMTGEGSDEIRLGLGVSKVALNDEIWALIDPSSAIPREPADLELRLSGLSKINVPLSVEEQMDAETFGEIEKLDIGVATLSAAGASVDATGGVTFDNSGDVPKPLGDVRVTLRGLTTLSQALVQAGIIDQMQAGMAMGMIMAFGKPGDGPDEFVTDITFTQDGILANGTPIPQ
ncbi:DUF2125 domain-containing protein [Oceanomicrobium pacificus]|uniref:DUF2125 domain-containing protein n=1 Tax=Oceanomicrobium pacificus TaxID=2692916 RepID=A0A6B0TJV9_9RHOB|nr:DUF2125 domain-containing protein [Oceanomicrobium pacificus]MXU64727.1 DUF2125 domain-containing protein [Oceanomicrobium pacificus]